MDIFFEISTLLKTGLKKESLTTLVSLCELGVNPEALAEAVRDLRAEKEAMLMDHGSRSSQPRTTATSSGLSPSAPRQ
eukprot:symbB.v1.2.013215.t1/scaffold890.1/size154879/1